MIGGVRKRMRVIIVSEERRVLKKVKRIMEGYEVEEVGSFLEGIEKISGGSERSQMMIVDYDLSSRDGVSLLQCVKRIDKRIRTVLMVDRVESESAGLVEEVDLIVDYRKPEHISRYYIDRLMDEEKRESSHYIRGSKLVVDEVEITLKMKPLKIAEMLISNAPETVSREEIASRLMGDAKSVRVVDSHIKRIRKELSRNGVADCIVTIYGVGYRWEDVRHS